MSIRKLCIFLLVVLTVTSSTSSFAVVIGSGNGSGNTNAPSGSNGDLGWNYVGMVNGGSGVYLGAYGGANWVLTAGHVYNDGGSRNFSINGAVYQSVSGSGTNIAGLDLYAYQITVGQGTGLSLLSNLTLAGTSPATGETLTMIGNGKDRADSRTYWNVNTGSTPYTWSEVRPPVFFNASGYKQLSSNSKRWGSNQADGVVTVNSTSMIQTTFDSGIPNEAQAAVGDSGGGVFVLMNDGSYQLAGIMDLVENYSGQPDNTAVFGNLTYSIDVASYRSAILDSVPEPGEFWLLILGGVFLAWVLLRAKKQSQLI
jgi:hypothetical protein